MPRRYQHSLLLTCGRLYVHLISTFKGVYGSEVGRQPTGRGEFPDRGCHLGWHIFFCLLPLSEKTTVRQVTYLHGHVVLLYLLQSYVFSMLSKCTCKTSLRWRAARSFIIPLKCILLMFSSIRGEWSLIVLTLISSSSQDPAGTHDDIQKQKRAGSCCLVLCVCRKQAKDTHVTAVTIDHW
ncbi:uncharacterized protein F5891DRAFT_220508 [Suillus fuscotomentosus]|uniref:Uncharacterized protein n=1 Tax=Suillus fuscotomentosus TaxID=1912939 RepID=A0AAD4HV19_9AGAM|nr:uncharacterized protein F5891DRAFT_220508 [Suillus fuscotomentosus]KAG1907934.1 hypothetical protein F5891DRAFT_220508 [Suillus fuscotomentosus]